MEECRHVLFFAARDMTDKELEKARRHFQKKRDSGGGDCGFIQKVAGNCYEISFTDKEAQERVLQRKFHTISFPDGELRLIVSRTKPTETPDQPKMSHSETFRKTNTKDLEKTYQVDVFLLHFLRDNPKALQAFQRQLSSIGCEVELNCDEEKAVVRGNVDKGPGGAFGGVAEKWERQVDRVIRELTESYVCHHVVEAKHGRVLLQDLSFVNEEVRVYTDGGYVVLVGKSQAVNQRVAILKKSLPIQKEKPVTESHLRLIEAEFSQEMRANYPEVKLSRGTGVIVMEGPEAEVQSGDKKLDELIANIKHRKILFPTPLLSFITVSGAASKYQTRSWQGLRSPVSIKKSSGLVLSSLSTDSLDKVQAVLEKDLKVSTSQLQGPAAVPPDLDQLKDILFRAQNEANSDELRVEVSFILGVDAAKATKVQLVGYSADVLELEKIIQDYQMNKVTIQDAVNLSKPEFVDCLDNILHLTGIKPTGVTLQVCRLPNPHVILSGPRCKVEAAKQALNSALASVTSNTLVLKGSGAQRYFQASGKVSKELVESSFQVIIKGQQSVPSPKQRSATSPISPMKSLPGPPVSRGRSSTVGGTATAHNVTSPINKAHVAIKLGSLENQQVNVLVAPMVNKQLKSTYIGLFLLKKAGNALQSKFDSVTSNYTVAPGDVLQVDGPPSLGCSKIFFIECLPWDGVRGTSVQALEKGLRQCLQLCTQQDFNSLAFPVIGPGKLLKYPLGNATEVLTDTICWFGSSVSSSSLSTIHIVIKPGYPDSEELYRDLYQHLYMKRGGEAIFTSLTSDLDEMTISLGGGVKLRIVFGDITDETTDVVVNTTDFTNFGLDGVCKDILAMAGPEVEVELKAAIINQGSFVFTKPGRFPCKAILHVCGENTPGHVEALTELIVTLCETNRYQSVAIPAIGAGAGGMQPGVVAGAFLRGIRAGTCTPLRNLRDIRVVLYKSNVFLAFHEEAMQMFPAAVAGTGARPKSQQQQQRRSASADLSVLGNSPASQQSVFLFLGLSRKSVDDAMAKLKYLYEDQCSTCTFKTEELAGLGQEDLKDLTELVETQGLYVQKDQWGSLSLSGQKDGVNRAMVVINTSLQDTLRRTVRTREEDELYTRVVWCIMNHNGHWERLPKTANYNLEKRDLARGMVDAQGASWNVDLNNMEATNRSAAEPRKIKRLENLPDFTVPLYWDSMAPGDNMKVFRVSPSSAEYRGLKSAFRKTTAKTVMKIERVQNIHLRRAYEGQKTHISNKNLLEGGAGEKLLYHGTTQENCNAIMNTGFDRRFAGQNGTVYGAGVYFAVNADYSAHPRYSRPAADGSQVLFVARVLTGVYTRGDSSMRVPPARDSRRPHDRFDSVVDKKDGPGMYVVFHDNQSYPDYLITFK